MNIHITPYMDNEVRKQICAESGRFLREANIAIQTLQGDVNANMNTTSFKQAHGPKEHGISYRHHTKQERPPTQFATTAKFRTQ